MEDSSFKYKSDESNKRKRSDDDQDYGQPPVVANGTVEFSLAPVNAHFVCKLCSGYYRDPYTIAECLHTFCKSCLFCAFGKGVRKCPECKTYLGTDPFKTALSDRTLQELVDKVLFPRLRQEDDLNEREFYKKRGIGLKPEFKDEENTARGSDGHSNIIHNSADDELDFTLLPEKEPGTGYAIPALARPCIRTSGRLKIVQLKKYVLRQLQIPAVDPSFIDILCNGGPVGNELSLIFVLRTIWVHPKEDFRLTYRFADDY